MKYIERFGTERAAWWGLEVGVTFMMVLAAIFLGILIVGSNCMNAFMSIVGPGDLIIYSAVLVGSAVASGLALMPRALRFTRKHPDRDRPKIGEEFLEIIGVLTIAAIFFVGLFSIIYCVVKVTVLKLEHEAAAILASHLEPPGTAAESKTHDPHAGGATHDPHAGGAGDSRHIQINRDYQLMACAVTSFFCSGAAVLIAASFRRVLNSKKELIEGGRHGN